jgi:hypothetical protein
MYRSTLPEQAPPISSPRAHARANKIRKSSTLTTLSAGRTVYQQDADVNTHDLLHDYYIYYTISSVFGRFWPKSVLNLTR